MRDINGPEDWYEYISGRVVRELNESDLKRVAINSRILRSIRIFIKWPSNTRYFRTLTLSKVAK